MSHAYNGVSPSVLNRAQKPETTLTSIQELRTTLPPQIRAAPSDYKITLMMKKERADLIRNPPEPNHGEVTSAIMQKHMKHVVGIYGNVQEKPIALGKQYSMAQNLTLNSSYDERTSRTNRKELPTVSKSLHHKASRISFK